MKTKYIITGIAVVLIASVGVNVYQLLALNGQRQTNKELTAEVERYGNLYSPVYQYFTALTVAEFKEKVARGDRFTVYIGRPDCSDCNAFEPMFEEVIQEKGLSNKLYYLNVRWLRESGQAEWNEFKDTYGFTQTPAFSTYEGGKQVSMIEWTDKGLPRSELEAWLKKQGIL